MSCFRDISLQQFGRLVPSYPIGRVGKRIYWACLCDCGNTKVVPVYALGSGRTKSCGCLRSETSARTGAISGPRNCMKNGVRFLGMRGKDSPAFKHGHSTRISGQSHVYVAWSGMVRRCKNPNHPHFAYYGGANPPVKVCERWLDFQNFLADMGEPPSS